MGCCDSVADSTAQAMKLFEIVEWSCNAESMTDAVKVELFMET